MPAMLQQVHQVQQVLGLTSVRPACLRLKLTASSSPLYQACQVQYISNLLPSQFTQSADPTKPAMLQQVLVWRLRLSTPSQLTLPSLPCCSRCWSGVCAFQPPVS